MRSSAYFSFSCCACRTARVLDKLPEKLCPISSSPAALSAQDSSAMQPVDSLVANFIRISSY